MKDGTITLRTAKTGQVVTLPILAPLAESIAATRTGDLAFVATAVGRPMVKEHFGTWFRDVCNAAGVKGPAHGLGSSGRPARPTTVQPRRNAKRSSDGGEGV